jgi:hypothetical protein
MSKLHLIAITPNFYMPLFIYSGAEINTLSDDTYRYTFPWEYLNSNFDAKYEYVVVPKCMSCSNCPGYNSTNSCIECTLSTCNNRPGCINCSICTNCTGCSGDNFLTIDACGSFTINNTKNITINFKGYNYQYNLIVSIYYKQVNTNTYKNIANNKKGDTSWSSTDKKYGLTINNGDQFQFRFVVSVSETHSLKQQGSIEFIGSY